MTIDPENRTVDIEKSESSAGVHPTSVFARDLYRNQNAQRESLYRIGTWIRDCGADSPGVYRAGPDLLLRNPPRLLSGCGGLHVAEVEEFAIEACRIVRGLDASFPAIQGPPGSGKTTSAAEIIRDLVRSGKKVGVCATGHEVIHLLLRKVISTDDGRDIRCLHKCDKGMSYSTPLSYSVRLMAITNGNFSSETQNKASQHGIRLLDRRELMSQLRRTTLTMGRVYTRESDRCKSFDEGIRSAKRWFQE